MVLILTLPNPTREDRAGRLNLSSGTTLSENQSPLSLSHSLNFLSVDLGLTTGTSCNEQTNFPEPGGVERREELQ